MPLSSHRHPLARAFSLVELLVVIALIAVMLALAAPTLTGIARGTGMKRAVSDVSSAVEQARAQAMASSTWVWLGFANQSSNNFNSLSFVIVGSKDGTTNTATSNLSVFQRPQKIENVRLLDARTSHTSGITNAAPLKGGDASFTILVNNQSQSYSGTVLAFSPRGEATLKYSARDPWIEIGIAEMRGDQVQTNLSASILTSGLSGQQVVSY